MPTRILIVDNDRKTVDRTLSILTMNRYDPRAVESGEECLSLLTEGYKPDLILMEIRLAPEKLDGSATAKIVAKQFGIPVVFHTDYHDRETIRKTRPFAKYGYIRKSPDNQEFLLATIETALHLYKAESEERKQSRRFKMLADASQEAILIHENGVILDVNEAFLRIYGYAKEEVVGKSYTIGAPPELHNSIKKRVSENCDRSYESMGLRKDGTVFPCKTTGKTIINEDGQQFRIAAIQDLSEEKKLIERLASAHEQLLKILNGIEAAVYVADMETYEILFINSHIKKVIGDVVGKKCWETIQRGQSGPCDFCTNRFLLEEDGSPGDLYQWQFQNTRSGKWFQIYDRAIEWIDGRIVRLEISFDITERINMERELENSVKEKEALIREMHHRVKNNLAMINSLINLKAEAIEDPQTLRDLENQITAIQLVHEKLHQGDELHQLDLHHYIDDLLSSVFSSAIVPVTVNNTIAEVLLPAKMVIPLGLIINEIATNALKHGFHKGENNLFSVTATTSAQTGEMTVVISNNGKPIDPKVNLEEPQSLGLQLITSLVEQLGGTLEVKRSPHPEFAIQIPGETD